MSGVLSVDGKRTSGESIRSQNVMSCSAIANVIKSSLGPTGLDKMMVDDIGDITITNDGATILKLLEVEHPAAKVLVDLAQLQDQEVGDGTTSVVIIAAELLKNANELVKAKIHPTSIISGYRLACKEACRYLQKNFALPLDQINEARLKDTVKTAISSKILGADASFFADIIVNAANAVKFRKADDKNNYIYPINNVRVLKALGQSTKESVFIQGYALNCSLASQFMPKRLEKVKIACLDFSLQKVKMKLGVQVLITDPTKIEAIRQRESDIAKERIQKIISAGANVILTTGGIDEMSAKYMVKENVMGIRRVTKSDLKKIAKSSGAQVLLTLSNLDGEESFDAASLGEAKEIFVEKVGDNDCIFLKQLKNQNSASILLRGPNEFYLDEMERSFHDGLCVVKSVMESKLVVPGGGAVEVALSIFLENFATSISSREQLAIAEFAKSLLVIPKTLAVNAAQDATDLVAKLRAYHNKSQNDPACANYKWYGLNMVDGSIKDSIEAGVLEPLESKIKSLKFATEAAITILRIDDLIKIDAKEKRRGGDECGY